MPAGIVRPSSLQVLQSYGTEWIIDIKDISDFVREQHQFVQSNQLDRLLVAEERVYTVADIATAQLIGVDDRVNPSQDVL